MSTYKMSSGKRKKPWFFYFYTGNVINGKREKIFSHGGYASQPEAVTAEALARADYTRGLYVPKSKTTLGEYLENIYLPTKRNLTDSSQEFYSFIVDKIKEHNIASIELQKLSFLDLANYKLDLQNSEYSEKTVYMLLSSLKGAMRMAQEADLIVKNPAVKLKLPQKPGPKGKHLDSKTMMQQLKLIKKYDYEIYIPILLMATASCRTMEAVGVRNQNIDLKNGVLKIANGLDWKDGKLDLVPLKTPKAYRTVPLLPLAIAEIRSYRNWLRAQLKTLKNDFGVSTIDGLQNPMDLLVLQKDGNPLGKDLLERRWKRLKDNHSDLLDIRLYDYRHSYAANLRDAGVPMVDISDLMGHESVSFTAQTYAVALDPAHKSAAVMLQKKLVKQG